MHKVWEEPNKDQIKHWFIYLFWFYLYLKFGLLQKVKGFTTLGEHTKQLWCWRDWKRLEERQIDKRINFSRTPSCYDVGETERD